MKFNTALSFLGCGLALYGLRQEKRFAHIAGYAALAVPLLIGLLTLVQYYSHTELGIDNLFFNDTLSKSAYPGRMSPATALNFLLLALGIIGIHNKRTSVAIIAQHLAIMMIIIAGTAIVAYILQSPVKTKVFFLQTMAIHTATLFLMLALVVLLSKPNLALASILLGDGPGSRMLRVFLKLNIATSLIIGLLEVYGVKYEVFDFEFGLSVGIIVFTTITTIYIFIIADRNNRADADLESKQHQLEDRNRELSEFVYIASHDLQEPMRTIGNYSALIKNEKDILNDEEFSRCIDTIHAAGLRMNQLLEGLMGYSRLGRASPKESVSIKGVIDEIIQDLELLVNESHARIYFPDMPTVTGHKAELRVLFQNLIANAIRYRKPDAYPEITIKAQKQETGWFFSVSDNGIGIDAKHQEKVFQIFQQLNSESTKKKQGLGIGLAYCRKAVQMHGGKIWVESTPGKGSTFYFTLKSTP